MFARLHRIVANLKAQRRAERQAEDRIDVHFDVPSYRVGVGYDNHAETVELDAPPDGVCVHPESGIVEYEYAGDGIEFDMQCRDCANMYDPERPAQGGFHVWGNEGSYWLCDEHEPERSDWLSRMALTTCDYFDNSERETCYVNGRLDCQQCWDQND